MIQPICFILRRDNDVPSSNEGVKARVRSSEWWNGSCTLNGWPLTCCNSMLMWNHKYKNHNFPFKIFDDFWNYLALGCLRRLFPFGVLAFCKHRPHISRAFTWLSVELSQQTQGYCRPSQQSGGRGAHFPRIPRSLTALNLDWTWSVHDFGFLCPSVHGLYKLFTYLVFRYTHLPLCGANILSVPRMNLISQHLQHWPVFSYSGLFNTFLISLQDTTNHLDYYSQCITFLNFISHHLFSSLFESSETLYWDLNNSFAWHLSCYSCFKTYPVFMSYFSLHFWLLLNSFFVSLLLNYLCVLQ